ncbi:MAG: VCBS repeat-containing protein, partial [Verrucomicrobia bacterium]|nr:VCBS repeat-containing protein [Verrucomicrobiota bacterium]
NTRVAGALEGEEMKIVECTGGKAHPQELAHFGGGWSDQSHLWWIDGKPGNRLTLSLPVKENGRYKLVVQLTKARDYGIVQLSLDGQKLGQPLDLYNPQVIPTGALDLGTHELKKSVHRLTLEIVGANEKAIKRYMAGLDYVKLERVP